MGFWSGLLLLVFMSLLASSSEGLEIRPATTRDDQIAIAALVIQNHLALSHDDPQEYVAQAMDVHQDFEHLANFIKFGKSYFFVAVDQGKIVASAGAMPRNVKQDAEARPDCREMELTGVTVAVLHRRQGLARLLVQRVLQEAASQGCRRMVLVTLKERMAAACALYESLGFQMEREHRVLDMAVRHYAMHFEPSKGY